MELSQYLVQATWPKNAVLAQIPHFSQSNVIQLCQQSGIKSVFDFLENEDKREEILNMMNANQKTDIIKFCNSYPNIELEYKFHDGKDTFAPGEAVTLNVTLNLDVDEDEMDENSPV